MRLKPVLILTVLPVLLLTQHARSEPSKANRGKLLTRIAATLDQFREDYNFPGATAAYVLKDGQKGSVGVGLADVESQKEMTAGTRMLAASIGKSFAAMAVLSLESEGLLSQSDRVSKFLSDRPWFSRLPNHDKMTIQDLLRHTTGLPDHVHTDGFGAAMVKHVQSGSSAMSTETAIAFVCDVDALFGAGDGWSYSDSGYLLLGLVIESVAGDSYYEVITERLLKPLELMDTHPSNSRKIPRLAVGYTVKENPFGLPPRTMDACGKLLWDPAVEWAGGGFVSTSSDLAAWGQALFEGTVLPTPYIERLLDSVSTSSDNPKVRYGTGVGIKTVTEFGPVYGHGGWVPGYVSSLRYYPDYSATIAFQVNSDAFIMSEQRDLVDELERALAEVLLASKVPGEVAPECP